MNEHKKRRSGIAVGTISLLVIFTILCLSVLALLSFSTVSSSYRMNEKSTENLLQIAAAKAEVSKQLAAYDAALATISSNDADEYYKTALEQAENFGFTQDEQEYVVVCIYPLDSNSALKMKMQLLPPGGEYRYSVLEAISISTQDWVPEDEQSLWTGN